LLVTAVTPGHGTRRGRNGYRIVIFYGRVSYSILRNVEGRTVAQFGGCRGSCLLTDQRPRDFSFHAEWRSPPERESEGGGVTPLEYTFVIEESQALRFHKAADLAFSGSSYGIVWGRDRAAEVSVDSVAAPFVARSPVTPACPIHPSSGCTFSASTANSNI
jgi:hypothetical protein